MIETPELSPALSIRAGVFPRSMKRLVRFSFYGRSAATDRLFYSFRGRLILSIFLIQFALALLLIGNRVAATKDIIYQRESETAQRFGLQAARLLSQTLVQNDTTGIQYFMLGYSISTHIRFIMVLDSLDRVLYSSMPQGVRGPAIHRASPSPETARGNLYVREYPMTVPRLNGAHVRIGFSMADVHRDIKSMWNWALGISFLILLATLFFAFHISGYLLRPLATLRDAAGRIAMGDFHAKVEVRSSDIIGELARAQNEMAARLGDLTQNLQLRIDGATAHLVQKNRELLEKSSLLQNANRQLVQLDRMKNDFVSIVSHDLRTPLTSIIGFAKSLQTIPLNPEQRMGYLRIIETEGRRMAGFIRDYLDISRIESGQFELSMGKVDLGDLIREILERWDLPGNLEIDNRFPADLPAITADPDRLRRLLGNLLDNAIHHSPEQGLITLEGTLVDRSVRIALSDQGPGVAPGDRGSIFDKYYRGRGSASRKSDGCGLGLSIVKSITEAHHGRVFVEDAEGGGARFVVELPLGEPVL